MDDIDFFPDLSVVEHLDLFVQAHRVADAASVVDALMPTLPCSPPSMVVSLVVNMRQMSIQMCTSGGCLEARGCCPGLPASPSSSSCSQVPACSVRCSFLRRSRPGSCPHRQTAGPC